jgi:hypothetical protein
MATKTAEQKTGVSIPAMAIQKLQLTLIGDSELIVHKWSEKAKKEMLDKHMMLPKPPKTARDPHAEYLESLYVISEGVYGFPTIGVKASAVSACSFLPEMTKVEARGTFHIDEEFVTIEGEHRMREDMVRVGMGAADLRYRAGFPEWRTTFAVKFNSAVLSAEQIVNLFNTAGFAVGIGEWRPQKNGQFGRYHVMTDKE